MKTILKIYLLLTLLGILLLLFLVNFQKPLSISISEISNSTLNKHVSITGNISNIRNYDNFQIIVLNENQSYIEIALDKNLNLTRNTRLSVTGRVEKYQGRLQIRADRIVLI